MRPDFNEIGKLVKKVKKQDSAAFAKLYELTYQRLFFLAFSILKNEEDAEDALQESYIKILTNIDSLKEDKLFLAWANKIVYSICIRMYTRKTPDALEDDLLLSLADENEGNNPINAMLRSEKQAILADLLGRLSPVLRSTLMFKYYEDLKIHQIAEIMDCPSGTVKSRLNMAKKQLRLAIGRGKRGDILLPVFVFLPFRKSFTYFARSACMDSPTGYQILVQSLARQNMGTGVQFHPQPSSASFGTSAAVTAGGTVAGGIAAVTLGTAVLSPPVIKDVSIINPPAYFTNQNVKVSAQIEGPLAMLSDIYMKDGADHVITAAISEDGKASFTVKRNGDYTVYAVSKNNRTAVAPITIHCIDKESPSLSGYHYTESEIILTVSDSLSGIDYDNVHGKAEDGGIIRPVSIDQNTGTIVFPMPEKPFRLFISDLSNNLSTFRVDLIRSQKTPDET